MELQMMMMAFDAKVNIHFLSVDRLETCTASVRLLFLFGEQSET